MARKSLFLMMVMLFTMTMKAQTDVSNLIVNRDFEGGSFAGWVNWQSKLQVQSNSSFAGKQHTHYVERWVASGSIGETLLSQRITGLANGQYTLSAYAYSAGSNGAFLFANDDTKAIGTTSGLVSLTFTVIDGIADIGVKTTSSSDHWICVDYFSLSRLNTTASNCQTELSARVARAQALTSSSMNSGVLSALNTAINNARSFSSNTASNYTTVSLALRNAIDAAERSIFATQCTEGGSLTVRTDIRYARGATMAFGRSTVTGSNILEQGFVYSDTNTEPTLADPRTTDFVNVNGNIYRMNNLTPATKYYCRAYAVNTSHQVAYGDVIEIITIPKGTLTYSFNTSDDADINARIDGSMESSLSYWNNLGQLSGVHFTANYASGTPTADCSYGGWIRFGPTVSYQAVGTTMHEMLHGIGMGTAGSWTGDIRSNNGSGTWLGKRTRDLMRFWDNKDTEYFTGDGTHGWGNSATHDYCINGADKDKHADYQYLCTGLIAEALCEDNLIRATNKFCVPAYTLPQNDGKTYVITNSDAKYGQGQYYLVDENGTLKWKALTSEEVQTASKGALWYITFTPSNQYYQIKNAGTNRFITYNSGFKTSTSSDDMQLLLSFADVVIGEQTFDAYHIIDPNDNTSTPNCLTATGGGSVTTATFSPTNAATAQRWVILEQDKISAIEEGYRGNLNDLIAKIKAMKATSHSELVDGADVELNNALSGIESETATASIARLEELRIEAWNAAKTFLKTTKPATYYDISFLIENAGFDDGAEGWNGTAPDVNYSCAEFYQKDFDIYQQLTGLPAGKYVYQVKAFQRPGTSAEAYAGTNAVQVTQYLNGTLNTICNICDYKQTSKVGSGTEVEVGSTYYIPNNMQAAAAYFAKGYYDNSLEETLLVDGDITIGIKGTNNASSYWSIFDDFRLYYYGPDEENTAYDITDAMAPYLSTASTDGWTGDLVMNTNGSYTNGDAAVVYPFMEKWVSGGNSLANFNQTQTITELPAGDYYIGGSFIATQQGDASVNVTGITFYAGDQSVAVATANGKPQRFQVKVTVGNSGTLTYGLKAQDTNANWVAMDNLYLYWAGDEQDYLSQATETTPVRIPLTNPRMENSLDGWNVGVFTSDNGSGNFSGPIAASWVPSGTYLSASSMSQELTLPQGTYALKAAVRATGGGNSTNGVNLFIGQTTKTCSGATTDTGTYFTTDKVTLDEGTYSLGLSIKANSANWVKWDNAVLYYYGETLSDDIKQTILANNGDASSLIVDAECDGLANGWMDSDGTLNVVDFCKTRSWKGADANNNYVEKTENGYVYQKLQHMPAGTYKLVAAARANTGGKITPSLGGTAGTTFTGMGDTNTSVEQINVNGVQMPYNDLQGFTTDGWGHAWQWISATHQLTEKGDLTIKFDMEGTSWMSIDNVHLYYMVDGEDGTVYCESIKTTDATQTEVTTTGKTVTADIILANPNTIIKSANKIITETGDLENNLVTTGNTMTQLRIYDKYNLGVTSDFMAEHAVYMRSMSNTFGTLILPYTYSADENLKFFALNQGSIDNEELEFVSIDEVEASNPVLVKKLDTDATAFTVRADDVAVVSTNSQNDNTTGEAKTAGWKSVGYYENTSLTDYEGMYYIANNQFWAPTNTLTIPAFRAIYINQDSQVNVYSITFGDESTAIREINVNDLGDVEIYDLSGRKVARPSNGLYIINGKKYLIRCNH